MTPIPVSIAASVIQQMGILNKDAMLVLAKEKRDYCQIRANLNWQQIMTSVPKLSMIEMEEGRLDFWKDFRRPNYRFYSDWFILHRFQNKILPTLAYFRGCNVILVITQPGVRPVTP